METQKSNIFVDKIKKDKKAILFNNAYEKTSCIS
jgi:hypothetical protein